MTPSLPMARSVSRALLVALVLVSACSAAPTERIDAPLAPQQPQQPQTPAPPPPSRPAEPTWDPASPLPPVVEAHYIDLSRIAAISRFRSGVGHDYSDDFERCRSMKHYFRPAGPGAEWGTVRVFAPVTGRVTRVFPEWAGSQLQIRSSAHPAFTVILFHVTLAAPLAEGDSVTAGAPLGTHVGTVTTSDVAVLAMTPRGRAFVSYVDALPAALFAGLAARGVPERSAFVIGAAERDARPLVCDGEAFVGDDPLASWVTLR